MNNTIFLEHIEGNHWSLSRFIKIEVSHWSWLCKMKGKF